MVVEIYRVIIMENIQYIKTMLQKRPDYPLNRRQEERGSLSSFEGAIKKHPSDPTIVVLQLNPFESHNKYIEFSLDSVFDIEEIDTISNEEGKAVCRVRLWIKKGSLAFRTEPFLVQ